MGVTGLWQILQPCARPIKIETLNRKRLAVDASIWIYQFLKAVRDKEGNALRNSHVVGFFRRICKLLFFGIKPVFVFDGGAPALKRQTIRARKSRREGRREDAVRTAGKLLAVQMQRRAEEEEAQRKADRDRPLEQEEPVPDEGLVYVDELQMTQQERNQNRKFRKKDQYHLPELDVTMSEMGGPNDPRVMSLEELQAHARSFETGEDINVYDFSKIDYDSPFFMSLPASDRYNILNAARLRSRLRMGHSKEQLDEMFPDRMAFSKFQIERVRERNELTQRLMNLNDYDAEAAGARIAGEKGREYVLVRNDGVEGGWALGVISEEGKEDKPIDIDQPATVIKPDPDAEADDDFEDVPIEGLNRLPKRRTQHEEVQDQLLRQRRAVYGSRRRATIRRPKPKKKKKSVEQDPNSLFIQSSGEEEEQDDWEEVQVDDDLLGDEEVRDAEDEDLQRAIAMSMQKDTDEAFRDEAEYGFRSEDDDNLEDFKQTAAKQAMPVPKGSARAIANILNKRAHDTAPDSREITSFGVPTQKPDSSSDEGEDSMDLQVALKESRRVKHKTSHPARRGVPLLRPEQSATDVAKQAGFSGPLPFEKLDLGSSLLGKKKMRERTEAAQGGFENPALAPEKKKQAEPLPPWFSGNIEDDMEAQRKLELEDREKTRQFDKQFTFQKKGESMLRRHDTGEVIDLDASDDEEPTPKSGKIIDLEQDEVEILRAEGAEPEDSLAQDTAMTNAAGNTKMADMADEVRADFGDAIPSQDIDTVNAAPATKVPPNLPSGLPTIVSKESVLQTKAHLDKEEDSSDASKKDHLPTTRPSKGKALAQATALFAEDDGSEDSAAELVSPTKVAALSKSPAQSKYTKEDEEILDWSDSDRELQGQTSPAKLQPSSKQITPPMLVPESSTSSKADGTSPAVVKQVAQVDDEDLGFEDVEIPEVSAIREQSPGEDEVLPEYDETSAQHSGLVPQESLPEADEFDDFSDPEDAEMLRALTLEAEEHARFASTLNNKTQAQNVREYEVELKQLRNQQKKDRRDADEVTQIMIQECQSLLRLFGLPYITAPMEAEAQCAELVHLGLVDGIVTDDSDCFLFGGTRIYKNMFNQAKFVECYLTSDLEKEFDLTRDKLIAVAHLLGSDYTEGIPGIGPVSALEIISEFGDLENFKEWWNGVQLNTIPKEEDANVPFRKKFRKNATKLFLPPAFPDERVKLAYLQPDVDADQEAFQWGVPDLAALRSFLMATIGWSQERTDEVLVPVIKDMNRRMDEGTQANITAFFDGGVGIGAAGTSKGEAFAPRKRAEKSGKRMGGALNRMAQRARVKRIGSGEGVGEDGADGEGGNAGEELPVVDMHEVHHAPQRKRKSVKKTAPPADASEEDASDFEGPKKKKAKRKSRVTKATGREKKAVDDYE